jgi:hypothetical protein
MSCEYLMVALVLLIRYTQVCSESSFANFHLLFLETMRNKGAYLFLIACILVCANAAKHVNAVSRDDIKSTIQNLYVNVVGSQYQESTSYIPFLQEEKIKGLFPSNVHINFHGDYKLITLRHLFKFAVRNNITILFAIILVCYHYLFPIIWRSYKKS